MYSVKWYRNGKEFYRHIPTDDPSTGVFRQAGLIVDVIGEVKDLMMLLIKIL